MWGESKWLSAQSRIDQNQPKIGRRGLVGPSWAAFGRSWAVEEALSSDLGSTGLDLGTPVAIRGRSWIDLGLIRDRSGVDLGAIWVDLGESWAIWMSIWVALGSLWVDLG